MTTPQMKFPASVAALRKEAGVQCSRIPIMRNAKFTTSRFTPANPLSRKYHQSQMSPPMPTIKLMPGECSARWAGVISRDFGGPVNPSLASAGSASKMSSRRGCIVGPKAVRAIRMMAARMRLKGWNVVSVIGMIPTSFSRKCFGVATRSVAEPEVGGRHQQPVIDAVLLAYDEAGEHGRPYDRQPPVDPTQDHGYEGHQR